ncbi:MAG: methyltransferase domain-containing protein [Gemmatimonadales bacterium]
MSCCQCVGIEREFSGRRANWDLARYRRRGPGKPTLFLIEALRRIGVEGRTLLDIGGGVGVIQQELLKSGASRVTAVEASPAYVAAARSEAERAGVADRVSYRSGDFVDLASDVSAAHFVTMDKVICCYPYLDELLGAGAAKAKLALGLVYPRDNWPVRLGVRVHNLIRRLFRHPFRAFVHPASAVAAVARSHGLEQVFYRKTVIWQVVVYARSGAT